MSCGKIVNTCPDKTTASCVKYEDKVSEFGNLDSCDCHTLEEVMVDTIEVVDKIYPEVFIEDFDLDCIDFEKEKDGTTKISTIVKGIGDKLCEVISELGLDEPDPCPGCGDPCGDSASCCGGLISYKWSNGEVQVTPAGYTNWSPPFGYDVDGVATSDGTYKITIDMGCQDELPNSRCYLGIAVNNNQPVNSPFTVYEVIPLFNSKTFHFILTGIKKNDVMKPMLKINTGIVGVDGIKAIYEKV